MDKKDQSTCGQPPVHTVYTVRSSYLVQLIQQKAAFCLSCSSFKHFGFCGSRLGFLKLSDSGPKNNIFVCMGLLGRENFY